MKREPGMEKALDNFTNQMFGRTVDESIKKETCTVCGKQAKQFRDHASIQEYGMSGMCQACQDEVFGTEEEP